MSKLNEFALNSYPTMTEKQKVHAIHIHAYAHNMEGGGLISAWIIGVREMKQYMSFARGH